MRINLNGIYQHLDVVLMFEVIFSKGYYIVGFILAFLIVIFPILINFIMIVLLTFMKLKRSPYLVKRLLILVAKLTPWNMLDVFFISILISMVKLFNYANLELDVAFLTLGTVVFLNILIFKRVRFGAIWEEYIRIYGRV
jgi:paraquat-inducible protein A